MIPFLIGFVCGIAFILVVAVIMASRNPPRRQSFTDEELQKLSLMAYEHIVNRNN